jgi:hypothetical protein
MSQPIVPVEDMAYVNALLNLLEILLTPEYVKEQSNNKDEKDLKTKLQIPFTFACIWAFGGPQDLDKDGVNYSQKFSDWWARNFTKVKIPSRSSVYDSWLDPSDQTLNHGKNRLSITLYLIQVRQLWKRSLYLLLKHVRQHFGSKHCLLNLFLLCWLDQQVLVKLN